MTTAKVTKLTKEELNLANQEMVAEKSATSVSHASEPRANSYSTEFIKKLKLSEIEKFFERFDVTACAKIPNEIDPKFVFVSCRGFNVVFSDYSFVFDFNGGMVGGDDKTPAKFDMPAFFNYCELTDQNPDQVIAETMAVELFGQRFTGYAPRRREVKQKENTNAFNTLSKSMQKTLATAHQKQQHSIDATYNKNYYGNYDISSMISTSDKQ